MGLFLAMAGIASVSTEQVLQKLGAFAAQRGMRFESIAAGPDEDDVLVVHKNGSTHTILWAWKGPDEVEELSQFLSRELPAPVLWMHIHDGDFWMYQLFVSGAIVDAFNPIPKYWDDHVSEDQLRFWRGDASVLATHWPNVKAESISRYLAIWDLGADNPGKAYPEDTHEIGSEWQILDFMQVLGLEYPVAYAEPTGMGSDPPTRQFPGKTLGIRKAHFLGQTFVLV